MIDDLEELYRTQRPQFCRAAAAIAGDRAAGEDAVQEAFANAVRKLRLSPSTLVGDEGSTCRVRATNEPSCATGTRLGAGA